MFWQIYFIPHYKYFLYHNAGARLNPIRIFFYGLLQELGVTSRTINFRRCSREQYLSCFQAISRRFWEGLRFVLLDRVLYKTKTLAKFIENRKCYHSPLLLRSRIMFLLLSKDFKAILKGVFVLYFWHRGVLYKTKTLAKFVENRKYHCSLLLLQARIVFDLFSSDFKTILKGSSFLGLWSLFCTHQVNFNIANTCQILA